MGALCRLRPGLRQPRILRDADRLIAACPYDSRRDETLTTDDVRVFGINAENLCRAIREDTGLIGDDVAEIADSVWLLGELPRNGQTPRLVVWLFGCRIAMPPTCYFGSRRSFGSTLWWSRRRCWFLTADIPLGFCGGRTDWNGSGQAVFVGSTTPCHARRAVQRAAGDPNSGAHRRVRRAPRSSGAAAFRSAHLVGANGIDGSDAYTATQYRERAVRQRRTWARCFGHHSPTARGVSPPLSAVPLKPSG